MPLGVAYCLAYPRLALIQWQPWPALLQHRAIWLTLLLRLARGLSHFCLLWLSHQHVWFRKWFLDLESGSSDLMFHLLNRCRTSSAFIRTGVNFFKIKFIKVLIFFDWKICIMTALALAELQIPSYPIHLSVLSRQLFRYVYFQIWH